MYKHVAGLSKAEVIINKSKFIGTACYVKNAEEARAFVSAVSSKYSDATHNCFAYVSDTLGNELKFSDNGEPSGTAGMPILEVIRNKKLVQTAVVVTRYFGGVKLGAGGLVRAYTDCAAKAIDNGTVVLESKAIDFQLSCDYNVYKVIEKALQSLAHTIQRDIQYTDMVTISLITKVELYDDISKKLIDIANGKIQLEQGEELFFAFPL